MSAGVTPDHSDNFPRDFEICPECGAKGVYRCNPVVKNGEIVIQSYWRCKYCKERFPLAPKDWLAALKAHDIGG